MIEAELKARLREPEQVLGALASMAAGRTETYQDSYYDRPDGSLMDSDHEVRLRTVSSAAGTRSLLTYKTPRVDEASGSKPEHETRVETPEAVDALLLGLGLLPRIAFRKLCQNFDFTAEGRQMTATVVTVPELGGSTFIELETTADSEAALPAALRAVRQVLDSLKVSPDDYTTELYTDAVAAARQP
jgi:adenylate cyclase class 2